MNKISAAILVFLALIVPVEGTVKGADVKSHAHSFVPEKGFIPDEGTAAAVAEALLIPIYSKREIERQKPFKASLSGDVWTVSGVLPRDQLGGVFVIQLSKKTGAVINVSHGR